MYLTSWSGSNSISFLPIISARSNLRCFMHPLSRAPCIEAVGSTVIWQKNWYAARYYLTSTSYNIHHVSIMLTLRCHAIFIMTLVKEAPSLLYEPTMSTSTQQAHISDLFWFNPNNLHLWSSDFFTKPRVAFQINTSLFPIETHTKHSESLLNNPAFCMHVNKRSLHKHITIVTSLALGPEIRIFTKTATGSPWFQLLTYPSKFITYMTGKRPLPWFAYIKEGDYIKVSFKFRPGFPYNMMESRFTRLWRPKMSSL